MKFSAHSSADCVGKVLVNSSMRSSMTPKKVLTLCMILVLVPPGQTAQDCMPVMGSSSYKKKIKIHKTKNNCT